MPKFSQRSQIKLESCDKQLQALFNEVIKYQDCSILSGHRGEEEQNDLYEDGLSNARYPNSNHNVYPSRAVDVMSYPVDWENKEKMYYFAGIVMAVAKHMGISIKWGGRFKNFFDAAHYELI